MRGKEVNIAKNLKYDGYQRGLASMFINVLIKKLLVEQLKMRICLIKNLQNNYTKQLPENLIKEKYVHLL